MRALLPTLVLLTVSAPLIAPATAQTSAPTNATHNDAVLDSDPSNPAIAAPSNGKTFTKVTPRSIQPRPAAPLLPLNDRERALQLLNRFTFGPRPGDLERVLAQGSDKWFEQQLNPDAIPNPALDKRLADYPTLNMPPDQAIVTFPDRSMVQQVADGKRPAPTEPLLAAMYEVQIAKLHIEQDAKKFDSAGPDARPKPTDAELAAQKKLDQATATRLFGDLFELPKNQRMAALIKLPVADRIAFTSNLPGDQKNLVLADLSPREREVFQGMASGVGTQYNTINELSNARILRDILSERQLQEVMTDFWFNHFNIFAPKDSDQWYTTSYERDTIRKHALGKFRDLLLATAESPAMMIYLDNWLSIGPDSQANGVSPANPNAKKGNKGLNENYGREVMELHTVGVNGGYSQADVTHLAAILTGWTVDRPNLGGPFLFDPKRHEPGAKDWFGYTIDEQGIVTRSAPSSPAPNQSHALSSPPSSTSSAPIVHIDFQGSYPEGMKQGIAALSLLAASPQTAHFISFKLAQRFVADEPPAALVDRMAHTYLATDGDIKSVLRTLVTSPEFNSYKYFRNKVKTPMEYIASAFRTTATDPINPGALANTLRTMGMQQFYALPPTGYYITADQWMNSSALVDRLNFAYQLTNNKFANQKFDSAHVLALGLMSEPSVSGSGIQPATFNPPAAKPGAARTLPISETTSAPPPALASPNASGSEVALHVLETTLIGGEVSAQTNQLIHKQLTQTPGANPTDTLNLLTALVMGSPEFQLR